MPGASPRGSKRRPAPRNSGRTRCASARATPASSSAASAAAAFRRLWSRGTPSSNETGSRSSPRTCAGDAVSQRSKSSRTSSSEAYSAWWSSSTFVRTAICGRSSSSDRSDSSPSATSQPSPARALPPSWAISPPMRNAGSSPSRSRQNAIIPAVVVLPCAPATTMERRAATNSASSSPRRLTSRPASSGLSGAIALDTITSAPSGTFAASWPIATGIPASSSRSTYDDGARSEPPTSAPHACATRASALMHAPPIPTNQNRLPSSKSDQLLSDLLGRIGLRDAQHRRAHLLEPPLVVEQRANDVRSAAELRLGQQDRPPGPLAVARVLGLVVGGCEGIRDEDRGQPCCRELPHRRAASHQRKIYRAVRAAEPVENRDEHVVGPRDT